MIDFLAWLRNRHDIRSLRELPEKEFMKLADAYNASRGIRDAMRSGKWSSTHYMLSHSASDAEAMENISRYGTDD
jgi:hypothetical protein